MTTKRDFVKTITATVASLLLAGVAQADPVAQLSYDYDPAIRTPVPIPQSERHLQAATAELWFSVPGGGRTLEGACLDKVGNLFFTDTTEQRVLKLTLDKKLTLLAKFKDYKPAGMAIDKSGRLFVAAMDLPHQKGVVLSINPAPISRLSWRLLPATCRTTLFLIRRGTFILLTSEDCRPSAAAVSITLTELRRK